MRPGLASFQHTGPYQDHYARTVVPRSRNLVSVALVLFAVAGCGGRSVHVGDTHARVKQILGSSPSATKRRLGADVCWYFRRKDLEVCFRAGRVTRTYHPEHL
ncbi:MAG: hypothetical protein QOJ56_4226 [Mycobacterium sp.]|jgi:hypothetical protein|nr:hypothetical protein [Mycobacterium sp.]